MKLPRDLSGEEVARLLARCYGYRVIRTKGSHMTAMLETADGKCHSVTIPRHRDVRVGTLAGIVNDISEFLGDSKDEVHQRLFE